MRQDDDYRDERDYYHERYGIRLVFRLIFGLIAFAIIMSFFFGVFYYPMQGMMYFPRWIWGIFGLLFVIWIISWIFRGPWHRHGYGFWGWDHEHGQNHEMRILRRRYARGDITEAEYKKMMKVLKEEHMKDRDRDDEDTATKPPAPPRRKR